MKIGNYEIKLTKDKMTFGDLRNHPNAIGHRERLELAKDILSKKKVLIELKEQSQQLAQKEIADWRSANQYALNHENPKRFLLYQIYYDAMLDDHLLGAIRNRKLKVMRTKFKVVDQNGKENTDMTKTIQGRWLKKFMSLALDSIFYGHSLIQLGDIVRDPKLKFVDIELLPRPHVIPEYHVIIKEVMDEPKQGFDYMKPPFSDWCISVGDKKDLGLLLPVSKDTISKKYALQFWDQFAEIFGMPVRIGKSSTRNKKDLDNIEKMLEDMGSAAWGLFPEGTEIEIVETKRGDAFNVYDKRIERANSEMSKAILGQTMTMDNGSSKSQATVHAEVAEDIAEADADFLKDVINDDLFPLLIKHGWPLANYTFDWDLTYEYTPKEMVDIEEMLLEHFEIPKEHFQEKYNIEITGVKQIAEPTSTEGEKKKLKLSRPTFEGVECCGHEHDDHITLAKPSIDRKKINSHLLRLVWDNRKSGYSYEYFEWLNNIYLHALTSGWSKKTKLQLAGEIKLDFDTPDHLTQQMFELNVFAFSASKSGAAIKELNILAKENDTFNEFSKQAQKTVLPFYNENALSAEYNHAWATSQNAAEYHRILKLKDEFPTWQYVTVGDDRVRPAHKALHGMKFKADDPAFDSIYPPNGWGCRCYIKPLAGKSTKYATKADAETALAKSGVDKSGQSELDRMIKGGFNKNRAKIRTIFDTDKLYVKGNLQQKLTWKDQGLEAYSKIDKSKLPGIKIKERDFAFATNLLADNTNLFVDYAKRKIEFTTKTLKAHNKADRLNIIEFVPEVLAKPDEVFMSEKGSSKTIQLKHIKHYGDRSIIAVSDITDDGMQIKTWFEADKDKFDRDWRTGILIKKTSKH